MNFGDFIVIYLRNMEYLSSKKTRKINAIVCLKLFSILPIEITVQHFERFLREIVPEVQFHVNAKKVDAYKHKKEARSNFSYRKEEIRKTQMFKDFDLLGFFKQSVKDLDSRVREKGLSFMDFERKDLEARFIALLNN